MYLIYSMAIGIGISIVAFTAKLYGYSMFVLGVYYVKTKTKKA
jgi:hypothetical protein